MRIFKWAACLLILVISCRKISEETSSETRKQTTTQGQNAGNANKGDTYKYANENLLQLVLTGEGGWIQLDSNCNDIEADTLCRIKFPEFISPSNTGGMLSFASESDYNNFIAAANLMERLWQYPKTDYEDTPEEINHLGEESFNALDSALGFQSLRHKYEINEFYDSDWTDTAYSYLDNDDYTIVMNQDGEVKIGTNYYKYLFDDVITIVNNSNLGALNLVRQRQIFARDPDVHFFNENLGRLMTQEEGGGSGNPPNGTGGTHGCGNFEIYGFASNTTPPVVGTTQWTVRLLFSGFYNLGTTAILPCVKANWQINWGDGTTETFVDNFSSPAIRFHTYTQAIQQGGSVTKNISITCQIVNVCTDPLISFNCPNITNLVFNASASVVLAIPPPAEECMGNNIRRKFYDAQFSVGGKNYRLHCKLKQQPKPAIGWPDITATVIFEKQKGNKWKKANPVHTMGLILRGKVYSGEVCNVVYKTLNYSEWTGRKSKIKLKETNLQWAFHSRKSLPNAINADYIWYYNNGQSAVGVYNEVLKP